MSLGEILMAGGAVVWLVGELIGLKHKQTTSHFVELWTKTKWWHRAIVVVAGELLIAHFNSVPYLSN